MASAPEHVAALREFLGAKLVAYLAEEQEPPVIGERPQGIESPAPTVLDRRRAAHQAAAILLSEQKRVVQVQVRGMNPALDDPAPARELRRG